MTTTSRTKQARSEPPLQVYREYFPASVLLEIDGAEEQWHRCRVFLTTGGLLIFRAKKPLEAADFSSPIDMEKTKRPSNATTFNVGVDIYTEKGLVVITPTGGGNCSGCAGGGAGLKRWRPEWSGQTLAWPT